MASLDGLLPRGLVELLEEEARNRGSVPEAVLAEILLTLAPEERRPGLLLETAVTLLRHADLRAGKGEYGEACRRLWAAALAALDAYGLARGSGWASGLRGYWSTAERLASETGLGMEHWYAALAARLAAMENVCTQTQYEAMRSLVRGLVDAVEGALGVAEE